MSKRQRDRRVNTPNPSAPSLAGADKPKVVADHPGAMRRAILILTVMLFVLRPLLRGEDAGQVSDFNGPGTLLWGLLAFVGLAMWSIWRLWADKREVYLGPVEIGLFALAGLWFLRGHYAPVRHPAWLSSWEWVCLAAGVFLVRQLAVSAEERQGLTAALLATAVALAVEAAVQVGGFPEPKDPVVLKSELDFRDIVPKPWEMVELSRADRVHGSYFYTTTLISVLLLACPALLAGAAVVWRGAGPRWYKGLLTLFVLLVLAVTGMACHSSPWEEEQARALEVWPAAWGMLGERPFTGFGPEQFAYFYPRHMSEAAGAYVPGTGNAFLDLGLAVGLGGMVLLAATFGSFAALIVRWFRRSGPTAPIASAPMSWEFYLGGMLGLVVGFVMRAAASSPDDILNEAVTAAIRSVAWFTSCALFERVVWPTRWLVVSLALGVGLFFVAMMLVPVFTAPSAAGLMWLAVALILAFIGSQRATWLDRVRSGGVVLPPALIALTFFFFAVVLYPGAASAAAAQRVRQAGAYYTAEMRKPEDKRKFKQPVGWLQKNTIEPLRAAVKDDPENLRNLVLVSKWYSRIWVVAPTISVNTEDLKAIAQLSDRDEKEFRKRGLMYSHLSVAWTDRAQRLAPDAPDGIRAEFERREDFARALRKRADNIETDLKRNKRKEKEAALALVEAKQWREMAANQDLLAAEALRPFVEKCDPTNPELHYHLAVAFFGGGKPEAGRLHGEEALRLDNLVRGRPRSLPDEKRLRLENKLKRESEK